VTPWRGRYLRVILRRRQLPPSLGVEGRGGHRCDKQGYCSALLREARLSRRIGLNLLFLAPGETGGMETYEPGARFTVFAGRELAAEWRSVPWHPTMRLVGLPLSSRTRIRRTAAEQALVAAAAVRAEVDLLHSPGNTAPLLGPRSVVTVHDLIYAHYPATTTSVLSRGLRALLPAVCRKAHRILVPSRATARDLEMLLGISPGKIDVIPEGPGHRPTAQPTPERELRARLALGGQPLVLSLSARRPHKNLTRLIEAIARVPEVTLVLPGYSTRFDAELRRVARESGAGDRVVFCGWVSDEDLEGLYRAARCLAFPSLAEGFGLPVLEAMARGVPVTCSNASALPEVAGDAALLFDPESVDAIAAAVRRMVADERLRAHLAARGRARAATFSWEATAAATVESYRRALS
jgi:glycosyltransferase involved in cell wall biosynthesis